MWGSETWVLTQSELFQLASFESNILRKIYGPIREGEAWRIRYDRELNELYRSPSIRIYVTPIRIYATSIRICRLRWTGDVQKINEGNIPKRILKCTPEGK